VTYPNRRDVVKLLGGTVAGLSFTSRPDLGKVLAMPSQQPQRPVLDGELRLDEASLSAAADDFGHVIHNQPAAVLLPGSTRDVSTAVKWARRGGRHVAPQGQSHSVYGRAQASDGMVIDMTPLRTVHHCDEHQVVVDAGATWRDVLGATLPLGRTPPVLADYLDLSVGGTVVVGGVGAATAKSGVQSDNVVELDVVTGTGRHVTCSSSRNSDLFDAVRAGLGQVGIITRATIPLVAAPRQVRRFLLYYADLSGMLNDERLLDEDGRFDSAQGAILPTPDGWIYRLEAVVALADDQPPDDGALLSGLSDNRAVAVIRTTPYVDYISRLDILEKLLRTNGQWFNPHPWLTTFVGDTNVESVVARELAELTPTDLGQYGQVVLSAFRRDVIRSPMLRLPGDDLCYAFNLVRFPNSADPTEASRLIQSNRSIYERIRAAGGTLYPVSAFPMTHADWKNHFGPEWATISAAKRKYDPDHILTPGYELFSPQARTDD
jgi:cytokinin dehydrogenase